MTISQPKSNEEEISLRFQAAIERLEKIDADAKEKKTQIVKDLAKNLEGKIPTDRIANEIVHQLRGKVSERLIHSCLEKKYKEKYRVENAQKRKKKREVTAESAAPLLLEQEKPQQLMVAVTEEGKSVTIDETSKNREASISKRTRTDDNSEAEAPAINQTKSVSFDEQTPYMKTDINGTSLVAIEKLAQNRSGKGSESDLEKCPKCSVLRLHNQELEEALRKTTTLSTADTLYSTVKIIPNEESEIEFSLPCQSVQQYVASEYKRGKSQVWFSVKINVKTKEVTSAKTGRISELVAN